MGVAFLVIEVILIAMVGLAVLATGVGQLEGATGILRDGLPGGRAVPRWSLPDLKGVERMTPSGHAWQYLIFADHSLAAFPGVAAGMNALGSELEVLMMSRDNPELCWATVRAFDLRAPIVRVDQSFYNRFRVRVMPFAFLLDPMGKVRWRGLVNTDQQMIHVWRTIQATESGWGVAGAARS